jgi:hypothetical protein
MLTFCNRYKTYFLGILLTLLSFGAYAHSVAVWAEIGTGSENGKVRFHALTWHSRGEFGGTSGSMFVNGTRYGFVAVNPVPNTNTIPGRLVASCNGYSNYLRAGMGYQTTNWISGLNLCNTLSFSMTSYYLEAPGCNLSGSVNLSVPTVTAQPISSTTKCSGANYSLSVAATGASLVYQWSVSTNGGATFNTISGGGYSGETTSTLTYNGVSVGMNGYKYRCFISSTAGCSGVPNNTTTNTSTLTVNSGVNITSQPVSASVCSGGAANFSVNTTGSGITYRWSKNGTPLNNGGSFSGVTSPTLSISNATTSDQGSYTCVMSSSSGCGNLTSNAATFTVTPATTITGQSSSTINVCEGANTPALTVTATGQNLAYQWQVSTNGGGSYNNVSGSSYTGATSDALTISNVSASLNNAKYRCVVSGACGASQTTTPYSLAVYSKPTITLSPASKSVCENGTTTFAVSANGTSLSYQWKMNGNNIISGAPFLGENTAVLTIASPSFDNYNSKAFSVVVSSGVSCGTPVTSSTATLTVSKVTAITVQPSDKTNCEGANETISLTAVGTNLTYQWQERRIGSVSNSSYSNVIPTSAISGVNSSTLSITSAPTSVAKEYIVQVAGNCGTTSSTVATLNITELPRITVSPVATSVCTGGSTFFNVTATPNEGVGYKWQEYSTQTPTYTNISDDATYNGSETYSLTITPTEILSGNLYRVRVRNLCGEVYSNPAILTVNTNPNVAVQPVNLSLCEYTSGTISLTSSGNGLEYQWKESADGNSWTPLTNSRGGGLDDFATTGTTTNKLRLSSVPFGKNNYQYLCEISSNAGCGTATSTVPSTVTVWERPVITLQPVNANNNTPSSATLTTYTFKTQVTGKMDDDINQSFSWHESYDNAGSTFSPTTSLSGSANTYSIINSRVGGTSTSVLTLTMPASRANEDKIKYLYRCLITGVCKNKTTNVVRVNPPPKIK